MRRIGGADRLRGVERSRRIVAPPVGDTIGSVGALLHLQMKRPGISACRQPVGTSNTSPRRTACRASSGVMSVPEASAPVMSAPVTDGARPSSSSAPGAASRTTHASCLPIASGPCITLARSSSGCTCTESRSCTSSSFTNTPPGCSSALPNQASPIGPLGAASGASPRRRSPPHTRPTRRGASSLVEVFGVSTPPSLGGSQGKVMV